MTVSYDLLLPSISNISLCQDAEGGLEVCVGGWGGLSLDLFAVLPGMCTLNKSLLQIFTIRTSVWSERI